MKRTAEPESAGTEIDNRAAVMAVLLIESELLAILDAIQEINLARLRIRKLINHIHNVRDGALEALVNLTLRSLDIRYLARALEALTLEDDLATIGVGVGDAPPDTDSVGMLLRRVYFDLDRKVIVLAQEVLDRVDIVLSHVAQSTGLIVPIATEALVNPVGMVRLDRGWSKPEIIIQLLRNRLRLKIFPASPIELPGKSGGSGNPYGKGPSEKSAVDELLQGLNCGAETIEGVLETEPCVQTEDAAILVDSLNNFLTLTDSPCHRFLAENVFSGLGCLDSH